MVLDCVSVQRGRRRVLSEVEIAFEAGERWALFGGNGAGKTQLLKLLSGDVWPVPADRDRRMFRLGTQSVDLIEAKPRVAYIGAELQDKYARYDWNLVARDVIATGLHRTDLLLEPVTAVQAKQVARIITACGLGRVSARRFLTLSYGQKRLTLLARALVQRPDWLLLDEFYNGLDTHFRQRVDRILDRARRGGQSWIVAAHRASDVPRGTGSFVELSSGRVQSSGKLTRRQRERLARLAGETGVSPRRRLPRRLPAARTGAAGADGVSPNPAPALISLRNVTLFVEYRAVLREVDWELRQGEHWAIFGGNGAGKSSFLKLLYGDLSPALGGVIERNGHPRGTPITDWKRRVGYVSPELQSDYAIDVTVADVVASGRHASIGLVEAPTPADRRAATHWLEFFGLSALAESRPRELSYGQLRRVLIARALAGHATLLLLDEPFTGLDPKQRAAMKGLMEKLMANGITLVTAVHHAEDLPKGITHELRLARQRATRLAL